MTENEVQENELNPADLVEDEQEDALVEDSFEDEDGDEDEIGAEEERDEDEDEDGDEEDEGEDEAL